MGKNSLNKQIESKSFYATNPDSYEAGLDIGRALSDIRPEFILLFPPAHYNFEEVFEGLYSGLGTSEVLVFGGTGDGFDGSVNLLEEGIGALGINSHKKIKWTISIRTGADISPFENAQSCIQNVLENAGGKINTAIVLADFSCDGVKIVDGVRSVINQPFIGGLIGDYWNFKPGYILLNGKTYPRSVGIVGMSGDFEFAMNVASGWKPTGKLGFIEKSDGNQVEYVDGKTTYDFLEEQLEKQPEDAGLVPMAAYESTDSDYFFLRGPSNIDVNSGKITYVGSLPEGTPVRVCKASEQDVVEGVVDTLKGLEGIKFTPLFSIIITCRGRRIILKDRAEVEVSHVFQTLGITLPILGFPSFGELAPFRKSDGTYTNVFFHNVSYSILLVGESK